jgi:hypothetical protein
MDTTSNSSFTSTTPSSDRRKKRNFTPQEDSLIIEGYHKFTDDWDKILEYTKLERTTKQIKSRFTRLKKTRLLDLEPPPPPKRQKTTDNGSIGTLETEEQQKNELQHAQNLLKKKDQEISELLHQIKHISTFCVYTYITCTIS